MSDDAVEHGWAAYSEAFKSAMLPGLIQSGALVTFWNGDNPDDVRMQFFTELGAMIVYDKPIILCVMPGSTLPSKLVRVADAIIEYDPITGAGQDALAAAIQQYGQPSGVDAHDQNHQGG